MSERISPETIQKVRHGAEEILGTDNSGHGMDHVERVYRLAMGFVDELPDAQRDVVALGALLHDVDDYKLVGKEKAEQLGNATKIMEAAGVDFEIQEAVREMIATMGYSKSLKGVRPATLEGMILSDADMCDALGASGTIRCLQYAVSDKGSGIVFDPEIWPNVDITAGQYTGGKTTHDTDSFVNHHFEKLLKLPGMMLTEPGKREAVKRGEIMVKFLRAYFEEQNVPDWNEFLDKYLASR